MAEDDRESHDVTFEAAERGRAFVARIRAGARRRDWTRVLEEMRKALALLSASPLVAGDPVCERILADMADADDMEAVDFLADQLARRVSDLIEAKARTEAGAAANHEAPRAPDPVRAPLPAALARAGTPETLQEPGDRRGARTVLKL